MSYCFFFFNDTATTEIYTLSLHDALPISSANGALRFTSAVTHWLRRLALCARSEEHTSELQSRQYLVCRLLLEKKKKKTKRKTTTSVVTNTSIKPNSITRITAAHS